MGKTEKPSKGEKGSRVGSGGRMRRPQPWESIPVVRDEMPPEEALPEDVLQAIAELGGVCSEISISRRDARRKYAYLDRVPADEFSLEWLKHTYGGGEYLARFLDSQKQFRGSKTFTIDGSPKELPVAGDEDPGRELRDILQSVRELAESQRESQANQTVSLLFELLKEARTAAEDARKENRELLLKFMEAQGKGSGDDSSRTLKLYDRMFEVLDRVAESKTELLEENASLRAELAESPGGLLDPTTARVFEKLLDTVPLLRGAETIGAGATPRLGPTTSPAPTDGAAPAAGAAPPVRSATESVPWVALLQHYISSMLQLAQEDRDPGLYADLLVDQLPTEAAGVLRQTIADHGGPDAFLEVLTRTWPSVAQYREWFAEYLRSLDETLRGDAVEDGASEKPQPPAVPLTDDD